MIIALAGRRIDAPDVLIPAFPLENVDVVRIRLRRLFESQETSALVCSAACGADLLALDVACELRLRRRIVLPFPPERFRETSVIDRPGEWGPLYDRMIADAQARSDLVVLHFNSVDHAAYTATNLILLDEAVTIATAVREAALAVLVWEGDSTSGQDLTREFGMSAQMRMMPVIEVLTKR